MIGMRIALMSEELRSQSLGASVNYLSFFAFRLVAPHVYRILLRISKHSDLTPKVQDAMVVSDA